MEFRWVLYVTARPLTLKLGKVCTSVNLAIVWFSLGSILNGRLPIEANSLGLYILGFSIVHSRVIFSLVRLVILSPPNFYL